MSKLGAITYTLPAYWASYLINGDASGISGKDQDDCDAFMANNHLPHPVDCGEDYFSWHNDATNVGGDVCDYTFLVEQETQS